MRVALCAVICALGCGSSPSSKPDAAGAVFDRNTLLQHVASQVLLPRQTQFADAAARLTPAISAYCDAIELGAPGTTLSAARAAFNEAIDAWESAEALLLGPAAMDGGTLRDRIYGWPLVSTCGIDRDTAARFADPASFDVSTKLVNVRSLAAIEYLLFNTVELHSCVTVPDGWDAIGTALPSARCRHAVALAADVASSGATLAAAWRSDGGNYVAQLGRAGTSGSAITSAQDAVNRVSDAMFYADNFVKDMKLAEAAGIADNACGAVDAPCEREVELRYADRATRAIRINLGALREAFTGTTATASGPSFDDFLIAVGHPEVAERMTIKLDAAITAANALPDSFLAALTTNYASIVATHRAIDAFTDDLKSQFLTLLALEIPDDVATDND